MSLLLFCLPPPIPLPRCYADAAFTLFDFRRATQRVDMASAMMKIMRVTASPVAQARRVLMRYVQQHTSRMMSAALSSSRKVRQSVRHERLLRLRERQRDEICVRAWHE